MTSRWPGLLTRSALLLSLVIFASGAFGATIQVPAEQPTIQAGLDAASAGDWVIVACGVYTWTHEGTGTAEGLIRMKSASPVGTSPTTAAGLPLQFLGAFRAVAGGVVTAVEEGGPAIDCHDNPCPIGLDVTSCDVFGNSGGDFTDCLAPFADPALGNFSANPRFCAFESGDFSVSPSSPCLPGQHPGGSDCLLIGALGEGCSGPPAAEASTWSALKARFRQTYRYRNSPGSRWRPQRDDS